MLEFHQFFKLDRSPDVLVLHVVGNDLGSQPFRELIQDVKFDLLRLWEKLPEMVPVWSYIVSRKV